jgi:hypothetical protein
VEFLIEVTGDDEDWEEDYSISSSTPTTGAAAGFFSALSAA